MNLYGKLKIKNYDARPAVLFTEGYTVKRLDVGKKLSRLQQPRYSSIIYNHQLQSF